MVLFFKIHKKDTRLSVDIVLLSRIGLEYVSQIRFEMVRILGNCLLIQCNIGREKCKLIMYIRKI